MKKPIGALLFFVLVLVAISAKERRDLTGLRASWTAQPGYAVTGAPVTVDAARLTGCQIRGPLPDPTCTPGAIQSTDVAAICTSGWASAHRDVPLAEWNQVFAEYGVSVHSSATYEVDHLIPLELGGSNAISNLFAEPANIPMGYHQKDQAENAAHDAVCSGKLSLSYAQVQFARDWTVLYQQLLGG